MSKTTLLKVFHLFQSRQFASFILLCGLAAIVHVAARWAFNFLVPYEVAILLAFPVGLFTAFFLCKLFVFDAAGKGRTKIELSRFFLVNLLGLLQTFFVSLLLRNWVFPLVHFSLYPATVAHSIGVACPVFTSFIGHKFFSFRKSVNVPSKLILDHFTE